MISWVWDCSLESRYLKACWVTDVRPGLRNTDFQQYCDYLHFTEEETIPCYSNYSLSFSVLIYHPLPQFFGECCLSHQDSFCLRGLRGNCSGIYLQIKTEDSPGLWGITGIEVCIWAPPDHLPQSRCTTDLRWLQPAQ